MGWQTIQVPPLDAAGTLVNGVLAANDAAVTFLTALKEAVKLASALVIDISSPADIAIKAAAAALNAAIDTLLTEADPGIFILAVPPRGVFEIPEEAKVLLAGRQADAPKEIVDFQSYVTVNASIEKTKLMNAIVNDPRGNAGFVRTVLDSLNDTGDASRPQMNDTAYIAGVYFVTGSQFVSDLMGFIKFLETLTLPKAPQSMLLAELPVPKGVTARVASESSVLLEWELTTPTVYVPQYKVVARIKNVAIIQSTSSEIYNAKSVASIFGTNTLTKGKTGAYESKVLDIVPNATNLKSYLDTTEHERGKAYYYAVSYQVALTPGEDIGFDKLSNIVKVYFSKRPTPPARSLRGTPPDWYRTPRVVDLIPGIAEVAQEAKNFIQQQVNTTQGYKELLERYVAALEQTILRYTQLADRFRGALLPLVSLLSTPLASGSYRTFEGTGGVSFLRKDLVDAFTDTSDPNRPPYTDGQYVTGMVILASTPTAATFLKTLLGITGKALTDIEKALEKIDKELSALEQVQFTDAMQSGGSAATTSTSSSALIGDDPSYCYHSYDANTTFGDDLQPQGA